MRGDIVTKENPKAICFETDPEYDFCDDCGKAAKKLYHKKPKKGNKTMTTDWYVCKKCFSKKD